MTKYEYKILHMPKTDEINNFGKQGWKIFDIKYSDGGNELTVVLEKEYKEMTELEFEKINGEI